MNLHDIYTFYGPGIDALSIAMMSYYCLGIGHSLSSQYSLQESILSRRKFQYCGAVHLLMGTEK